MNQYVKVTSPRILSAEALNWLLERCDSMPEGNICRCVSFEQFESLIGSLQDRAFAFEVLEEKPATKPLGKYVSIIVGAWLRDQEKEWRQHRFP